MNKVLYRALKFCYLPEYHSKLLVYVYSISLGGGIMRLIKGMYDLVIFIAHRPYQVAQIRFEKVVYKSKFIRAMAGYK